MRHRKSKNTPPWLGEWLLKSFCSYDFLNTALWDLEEIYTNDLKQKGKVKADLFYLWNTIGVIFHLYFKGKTHYSTNRIAMLKNNFIISLRNFRRNKIYTFLNLLGLSSGLIVFILITLYVDHEFSYDQYHENKDRIYRIYNEQVGNDYFGTDKWDITPAALAPAIMADLPEVELATRFSPLFNRLVRANDEVFIEPNVYATDSETFRMFSFEVIAGDVSKFLTDKHTAVISESTAIKYFGQTDVLQRLIYFNNEHPMQVVGIIKDMPDNSHFRMDVMFQFSTVLELENRELTSWNNQSDRTFVMLKQGTEANLLQAKLPQIRAKYADDPIDADGQSNIYHLQPLSDLHFAQNINFEMAPTADAQRLYTYLGIALLILAIAGINYVNLATAQAIKRTREIGIRKVIGAQNKSLIFQFLLESFLLVSIAMFIALLCLMFILPTFSEFVSRELTLDFAAPRLWYFLGGVCFGLGLLSGLYPSILVSSFKPISALSGKVQSKRRGILMRNSLVVFQFTICAVLILGTTVLSRQLSFIQGIDVGYVRDQVVVFTVRDQSIRSQLPVFKEELKKFPGVLNVASSTSLPNNISSGGYTNIPGPDGDVRLELYRGSVDYDFVNLYELEFAKGRNFSREIESDKRGSLLNESAVRVLGWDDPIGKEIVHWGDTLRVIGVLKDFHQHSLHEKIKPIILRFNDSSWALSVKMSGNQLDETIGAIESKYNSFSPSYPFEYSYFDDIFDRAYLTEVKTAKLTNWFAGLTILVACLGLYGLAAYKVEQRIKEVGIRKVLGASIPKILALLSKDFIKLVVIAFLVAAPIAYYVMEDWLNNFAYHAYIGAFYFIFTLLVMILIAGLAVGHRTYRAAVRNPVESLRDE